MSKSVALILCLALAAIPSTAASACEKKPRGKLNQQHTIALTGSHEQPSFYFRGENRTVMFFSADDVVREIEANLERYRREKLVEALIAQTDLLLATIKQELPLKEHTDLYKYVLMSKFPSLDISYLVADLLKTGRAEVNVASDVNDPLNPPSKTIQMISTYDSPGQEVSRWFCTDYGARLVGVTYIFY